MFPEKRKLLNKEQYRQEGIRETKKALKQLQEFCSSPECNTWKTVLRLENPIRFFFAYIYIIFNVNEYMKDS